MVSIRRGEVGFPQEFARSTGEETVRWLDNLIHQLTINGPECWSMFSDQIRQRLPDRNKNSFCPETEEGSEFFQALDRCRTLVTSHISGGWEGCRLTGGDDGHDHMVTHLSWLLDENDQCTWLREITLGIGGCIIHLRDFPGGNPRYDKVLAAV